MISRKKGFGIAVILFFVLMIGTAISGMAADKPIILKAGGISPPTADVSIAMEYFTKLVEKKTNGKMKVNFYPSGQLGKGPAQLENVTLGVQDIYCSSFAWVGRLVKDFAVLQLPFVFRDHNHLAQFMESDVAKPYRDELQSKWKMRVIAYNWWRLPRVIFAKKPIFTVEDMKGLKFRIANLPMYKKYVPAWGAAPTPVSWGEYYLALKQGLVDMGESCAENIYNKKFYEAAPFMTMLNFNYDFQMIAINEKRFQSLSPDLQKALVDAGKEAGDFFSKRVVDQFEKDKKKMMAEGTAIIYVDTKSWEDTIPGLAAACEKEKFWTPGLYEKIRTLK
jgi:TRAP-type transport system periplasmic protein